MLVQQWVAGGQKLKFQGMFTEVEREKQDRSQKYLCRIGVDKREGLKGVEVQLLNCASNSVSDNKDFRNQ